MTTTTTDFITMKETFFDEVVWHDGLYQLMNNLPDVYTWAKDDQSRFMMVNKKLIQMARVASEADMIGKTDFAFWPDHLADGYTKDDLIVVKTGVPIIDRVEFIINEDELKNWYSTCKFPLKNREGEIIGSTGFTKELKVSLGHNYNPVMKMVPAINYIQHHFSKNIDMNEIAEEVGMSLEDFEKRFQKILHLHPTKYLNQLRIEKAARYLIFKRHPFADIASLVGFESEGEFIKVFSEFKGMTPEQFKQEHKKN